MVDRRVPRIRDLAPLLKVRKPSLKFKETRLRRLRPSTTFGGSPGAVRRKPPSTTPKGRRRQRFPWPAPGRRSKTSSSIRRS